MAAAYISPAAEGAKPSAARPRHSGVRKTLENLIHLIFLLCGVVAVAFVLLISIYLILSGIPAIREIGLGKFLFGKVFPAHLFPYTQKPPIAVKNSHGRVLFLYASLFSLTAT